MYLKKTDLPTKKFWLTLYVTTFCIKKLQKLLYAFEGVSRMLFLIFKSFGKADRAAT